MGGYKDNFYYHCVMKQWSMLQIISSFSIWNGHLSKTFFQILKEGRWKLKCLMIRACDFNGSMENMIQILPTQRLSYIFLESVPIGNSGFKSVTKLDAPLLLRCAFTNTNITTDGLKLLKRFPTKRLTDFAVAICDKLNVS